LMRLGASLQLNGPAVSRRVLDEINVNI